ncbi:MAG TPA: hypothetical protein VEK07_25495 [Polyangiaceae bacterium]|nr:hypothetical protein [Polyangiaceae bacterium]
MKPVELGLKSAGGDNQLEPDGRAICGTGLDAKATPVIAIDGDPRMCAGCVEARSHRVPGLARLGGLMTDEPPAAYDGAFGERQKRAVIARDQFERTAKAANAYAYAEMLRQRGVAP